MFSRFAPAYQRCLQPKGLLIGTATMMCLMILATKVQAQKPKPPQLPPVRYQVQLWTVPGAVNYEVLDTNNQLQTVGSVGIDRNNDGVAELRHGFLYDPAFTPGLGVDLNDIVAGIPAGWHIRKATAINEVGQIAAYIAPTENTSLSVLQAVVIDMNPLIPVLHLIPDRGIAVSSNFGDINDWGDVVVSYRRPNGTFGHYTYNVYNTDPMSISDLGVSTIENSQPNINNAGVIVGTLVSGDGYRTSLSGGIATFPGLSPRAINENGAFCGEATVTTSKPLRTSRYAFVYGTSLTLNTILNSSASDLNSTLDSVVGPYWLNHRNLGNFRIVDLLDPTDPNTSLLRDNFFTCRNMTERDPVTNFPALSTSVTSGGTSWGVHLIPVPVP